MRKIELAREAAGPQRPAKTQLTVVETPVEAVVDDDSDAGFDLQDTDFIVDEWPAESPAEARAADAKEAKAKAAAEPAKPARAAKPAKPARTSRTARTAKTAKVDAPAPVTAAAVEAADSIDVPDLADFDYDDAISEIDEPAPLKTSGKQARPRPPVKAATWEEELRPQLPRRFQSSAYDELDPPVIALVPDTPAVVPAPAKAPKAPKTPKATKDGQVVLTTKAPKVPKVGIEPSDKSLLVRRFESVALVMAAILAILLGLAIGTILARTGSSDASPTPTSISQTAASQTAG